MNTLADKPIIVSWVACPRFSTLLLVLYCCMLHLLNNTYILSRHDHESTKISFYVTTLSQSDLEYYCWARYRQLLWTREHEESSKFSESWHNCSQVTSHFICLLWHLTSATVVVSHVRSPNVYFGWYITGIYLLYTNQRKYVFHLLSDCYLPDICQVYVW